MIGEQEGIAGRRRRFLAVMVGVIVACIAAFAVAMAVQIMRLREETSLTHLAGLQGEVLLDPAELRALAPLGADFDVAADGSVLFATAAGLHEAMPGGDTAAALRLPVTPDSFAFDRGGALLVTADGFLGRIGADGHAVPGVPLPDGDARLLPSLRPGAVYLIVTHRGGGRLYRFLEDGRYQVLLESDRPLVAATDDREHVYAATADMIVRLAEPQPVVMFKAPGDEWPGIRSLAATDDGLLLFSTPEKVFVLRDGVALSIINDSGGDLRVRDGRLFVLDARRALLHSLSPASAGMFREAR